MKDLPLNRLGEDGFIAERATYYAVLYAAMREAARLHGYALALHGSLTKDLDVIAVPWTSTAVDEETLVRALVEAAGGRVQADGRWDAEAQDWRSAPPRTAKEHGRAAWVIFLGSNGGYIDLSVMPRQAP